MSLEDQLATWTEPSSDTEQEKQERTERMIREAIRKHSAFDDCSLSVYAKGSYANNTNVRADSDVDIAVECCEAIYWDAANPDAHPHTDPYSGPWTFGMFRAELTAALQKNFPSQVDTSGKIAIQINSSSARVDADVVPCFTYRYYWSEDSHQEGTKIFTTDDRSIVNYPRQQLEFGKAKNQRTQRAYKRGVRILKRIENAMAAKGTFQDLPSYFVECLAYNVPDTIFDEATWTGVIRGSLYHIWSELDGNEPDDPDARWVEANECFYLFPDSAAWSRTDGRAFAHAAWNSLRLGNE
jgi:hypothetical protein